MTFTTEGKMIILKLWSGT